jgi:hypothetical protein
MFFITRFNLQAFYSVVINTVTRDFLRIAQVIGAL